MQDAEKIALIQRDNSRALQQNAAIFSPFAASLLPRFRQKTEPAAALTAVRGKIEPLLTVAEVAHRIRLSRASVYALCDRGELPHLRFMNAIRIRQCDLVEFLRSRRLGR